MGNTKGQLLINMYLPCRALWLYYYLKYWWYSEACLQRSPQLPHPQLQMPRSLTCDNDTHLHSHQTQHHSTPLIPKHPPTHQPWRHNYRHHHPPLSPPRYSTAISSPPPTSPSPPTSTTHFPSWAGPVNSPDPSAPTSAPPKAVPAAPSVQTATTFHRTSEVVSDI